jgi:hypothetical protein
VSLYHQLISTVSIMIMALALTWLAIGTYIARSMVIDNMQALAQNGATSLAISMDDIVANNVPTQVSVLFDAVAHLGPYSKVYFVDLEDNRLIERSFSNQVTGVPESFQRLIQLPTIEARVSVSADWTKLGYIAVTIDPQQAYQQLWHTILQKLAWNLAIALTGIIGAIILIRSILLSAQRPPR